MAALPSMRRADLADLPLQHTVDAAGGHGAGWLACWTTWLALHLADSLFPLWHAPGGWWTPAAAAQQASSALARGLGLLYRLVKAFGLPTLAGLVAYRSQIEGLQLLGSPEALPAWL